MNSYSTFFNFHTASGVQLNSLKYDFTTKAYGTLQSLGCKHEFIDSIANTLYNSMTHKLVFYHTPVHIMSLFSFAKENNNKLTPIEELSILFHDSIYRPGSKINEAISANFLHCLLEDTGVEENDIRTAQRIIVATASHLRENNEILPLLEEAQLVMDLDMSGFSAAPGIYNFQGQMIEKEFYPYPYNLKQFLEGRLKFLNALKSKKSIYRTQAFIEKFEKRAQLNLSNSIKEVERRIEVEL